MLCIVVPNAYMFSVVHDVCVKAMFICGLSLKTTVDIFMVHAKLVCSNYLFSLSIMGGIMFSRFFIHFWLLFLRFVKSAFIMIVCIMRFL